MSKLHDIGIPITLLACLFLTGCPASCPVIEPIKVPYRVVVAVDPKLTAHGEVYQREDGRCESYRTQALVNTAEAETCHAKLDAIGGIQPENPPQ